MIGSDNVFPKVILSELNPDGTDTATPAADTQQLFLGTDDQLYLKDEADVVTAVGGGGGGDTMQTLVWSPLDNEPPAAAFATADSRNARPVLDFDGSTDEEAVFSGVMPLNYPAAGIAVSTWWAFTAATTGTLRVQAAIERSDNGGLDIDADSFAAFQSSSGSAPATNGQLVQVVITFSNGAQMDSLGAAEVFRLKIRRDADATSGPDDITTDAELVMVALDAQ